MSGSEQFDIYPPPDVRDITHNKVTKLWLKCPECGKTHWLWPKEMQELDGVPENVLFERVLECWLSHDWTPDTLEEANEQGLVPDSWLESDALSTTDNEQ